LWTTWTWEIGRYSSRSAVWVRRENRELINRTLCSQEQRYPRSRLHCYKHGRSWKGQWDASEGSQGSRNGTVEKLGEKGSNSRRRGPRGTS
jgi:hypothetical protein